MAAAGGAIVQQAALNSAAAQAYEYAYPLVLQTLSEKIATDVPNV